MNCGDVTRLLDRHADREIDASTGRAIEEHLDNCPRCAREFASRLRLRSLVSDAMRPEAAPKALVRRVCESVWQARGGGLGSRIRLPHAAAVFSLVVAVMATWAFVAIKPVTERYVCPVSLSAGAERALQVIALHLDAAPDARFVVVAHNEGVNFLIKGARDRAGRLFEQTVERLAERGVQFRVCQNTLTRRGIPASDIIAHMQLVPSGIVEVGRLQSAEGYAYLKP